MITFSEATPDVIEEMSVSVRGSDVLEYCTLTGNDREGFNKDLWRSYYQSSQCFSVTDDDGLVCIFGKDDDCVWMVGTDRLNKISNLKYLFRYAPVIINIMCNKSYLYNVIPNNGMMKRFIKKLGAKIKTQGDKVICVWH